MNPIEIAERGYAEWAAKPHNAKWVQRIEGTPIPNDLKVCIAMAFKDALSAERARVIEMCARLPDDLAKNGEQIKLHAGELTAQEMRSVKAILRYVAAALRALGQQDTGEQ